MRLFEVENYKKYGFTVIPLTPETELEEPSEEELEDLEVQEFRYFAKDPLTEAVDDAYGDNGDSEEENDLFIDDEDDDGDEIDPYASNPYYAAFNRNGKNIDYTKGRHQYFTAAGLQSRYLDKEHMHDKPGSDAHKAQRTKFRKTGGLMTPEKYLIITDPETGRRYDLDKLRDHITTRPDEILQTNGKMVNSKGETSTYFNFGIPAMKGLAYDEAEESWVVVVTCMGASTCLIGCFGKGGQYYFPDAMRYRSRMLTYLINDPKGFENQLFREISTKNKTAKRRGERLCIRVNDIGDIFSPAYLETLVNVANRLPEVEFYAYTKTAAAYTELDKITNFIVRFSTDGSNKHERAKLDMDTVRDAMIVETELFDDLMIKKGTQYTHDATGRWAFKNQKAKSILKQRVAKEYGVKDVSKMLMDEEYAKMSDKQLGDQEVVWHVIIVHGGVDAPANDRRVKTVYNLRH